MNFTRGNTGGFETLILENPQATQSIFIFHGYGASYEDLAPLALELDPDKKSRWLFVNGPLKIPVGPGMEGRAWFPIEMMEMQMAYFSGKLDYFENRIPYGFEVMAERLKAVILEAAPKNHSLILGGFSQGSMIALATFLKLQSEQAKKLLLFSSTLLQRDKIIEGLASVPVKPKIFQSHGRGDPVLPFSQAEKLRDVLTKNGVTVDFHPFQGGHEIPRPVISAAQSFIS